MGISIGDVWGGFTDTAGGLAKALPGVGLPISAGQQVYDIYSGVRDTASAAGTAAGGTGATPAIGGYSALAQPDAGRVGAGTSALYQQLMGANKGFFAELDQQNALAQHGAGLAAQERALNEQKLRGDIASTRGVQGADLEKINAQRARLNQEPGFIEREYGFNIGSANVAEGRSRDRYETDLRNLYSDATARGALNTEGARFGRQDIGKQLLRDLADIGISKGRAGLGREKSLADVAEGRALLDAEAKKQGIAAQDLERSLNEGLARIGLQGQIDGTELLKALASTEVQKQQAGSRIAESLFAALSAPGGREAVAGMAPASYANAASSGSGAYGMAGRFTR